ncbi:hypothetical protein LTR86_004877 [Recurvomyces mirabilis]|nr:hypothetical protein LTR86_004877 [Recurvomyces mirabilis]
MKMDALDVSTNFRTNAYLTGNVAIQYVHDHEYTVGDQRYQSTGGAYSNIYNVDDGVVITYDNYGPQYKINTVPRLRDANQNQGIAPPALKQWRDIVRLKYRKQYLNRHRRLCDMRFI